MNERLDALRRRIDHEDGLISQRLSWLVASQAFLVSGFAITLNGYSAQLPARERHLHELLLQVIPWSAMACTVAVWLTLFGAIASMSVLRKEVDRVAVPTDPKMYSGTGIRFLGLIAPLFVPAIFLALWILVLCSS
jgi:disulfide bond formation protein DsbB